MGGVCSEWGAGGAAGEEGALGWGCGLDCGLGCGLVCALGCGWGCGWGCGLGCRMGSGGLEAEPLDSQQEWRPPPPTTHPITHQATAPQRFRVHFSVFFCVSARACVCVLFLRTEVSQFSVLECFYAPRKKSLTQGTLFGVWEKTMLCTRIAINWWRWMMDID